MAKHEGRRHQQRVGPALRDSTRADFIAGLRDNLDSRVFADDALRAAPGDSPAGRIDSMGMVIKSIERLIDGVAGVGSKDRPARLRRLSSYFAARSRSLTHHADALDQDTDP
jgi:hypothetical protein